MSGGVILDQLFDHDSVRSELIAAGLSSSALDEIADLFVRSARSLQASGMAHDTAVTAHFVPGRIEVTGNHTDYGGGRSIIAAIERGCCMVAAARTDSILNVTDILIDDTATFQITPDLEPLIGEWSNYPMTVARRIARNFPDSMRGADMAFASNLPQDAGLGSSSMLMIATFLTLSRLSGISATDRYTGNIHSTEDLAEYLGLVENGQSFRSLEGDRGVGTRGGCQDHTAILCSRSNALMQYSYRPARLERVIKWPREQLFAVGVSGVVAQKTGSAMKQYNRAAGLMETALRLWRESTGSDDRHFGEALARSTDVADKIRSLLSESGGAGAPARDLLDRFEHFFSMSEEIVPSAGESLARPDVAAFGELCERAGLLGERLLKNTVPETEFLARSAKEAGAVASLPFGAGFGGSVWAMINAGEAGSFMEKWAQLYRNEYPERRNDSRFFTTAPGPPAFELF